MYGVAEEDLVDETSPVNPQTAYAECKTSSSVTCPSWPSDDFSPTFLRNATAYGASPRMRFDIVLNNLCGLAWTIGEIRMESDGTPVAPFVHALDICKAIAYTVEAPRENVHGEVLNVGDSRSNYQIREVADIVKAAFPECNITLSSEAGPGQPELPRLVRQDPARPAGVLVRLDARPRGAATAPALRAHRPLRGALPLSPPHAPEADRVPPRDRPDRPVVLLDGAVRLVEHEDRRSSRRRAGVSWRRARRVLPRVLPSGSCPTTASSSRSPR